MAQFIGTLVIALPQFLLGSLVNFFVGVTLAVFAVLFVVAIVNAAQAIFISAVYHRVQGEDVPLVSNEQVSELFELKTKKMWQPPNKDSKPSCNGRLFVEVMLRGFFQFIP